MSPMVDVASVPPIRHREAATLAADEFDAMIELLGQLTPEEWTKPTSCEPWDVRAMTAHVVGMAEMQASVRELAHVARSAAKREDGAMIDAMTATQVRERAALTPGELVDRLVAVAPRAVPARRRAPAPLRWGDQLKQDPPFDERWTLGYLFDVVCTRDPWMHRLDNGRATGRPMRLRADHDGRSRRRHRGGVDPPPRSALRARPHGTRRRPLRAGSAGTGGEELELDALHAGSRPSGRMAAWPHGRRAITRRRSGRGGPRGSAASRPGPSAPARPSCCRRGR
jgi:uncharacterized protein (TIGR03083 family)